MFKNLLLAILIISFGWSSSTLANEEQIAQDCENTVSKDIVVGSNEYWIAVDECVAATAGQNENVPASNDNAPVSND